MSSQPTRRDILRGSALGASVLTLAACSTPQQSSPAATTTTSSTPSAPATTGAPNSGPAPVTFGKLHALAHVDNKRLRLHTTSGDILFWGGATLTGHIPGSRTGHLTGTAAHYRRWYQQMHNFGLHFVIFNRLHPAAAYAELARHNTENPQSPLYLIHVLSRTDSDEILVVPGSPEPPATSRNNDARNSTSNTDEETPSLDENTTSKLDDHAEHLINALAGKDEKYDTDVTSWLAAILLDLHWNADQLAQADRSIPKPKPFAGIYITSSKNSTTTEHWAAERLEHIATLLAKLNRTIPLALIGRPESDPLRRPNIAVAPNGSLTATPTPSTTPIPTNSPTPSSTATHPPAPTGTDLRPDHIAATSDWPGGTFAYYDAPPYRPDFITANENYGSDPDPYLAYIRELQKSIDGPLVLGGLGVSSCIGSGFPGSAGRSQGYHNEKHKFEIDSSLVEQLAAGALSGAIMSNWHDDWSAATWNTANRAAFIDRTERPIIDHDPLTADQWLGVVALDPRRAGERVVHKAPKAGLQRVLVDHDASWLYFTLEFAGRITSPVEIGFDLLSNGGLRLPGGSGEPIHDVAIRTVPTMSTTYLLIRQVLDPLQIDGLPLLAIPNSAHIGWNMQRILRSTASLAALDKNNDNEDETDQQRRERLAKLRFLDAGDLILGSWDPKASDFDSRATWHMARPSSDGPAILRYRLPWGLLDMLDAPRRLAFNPTNRDENQVPVKTMTITIESSTPGSPVSFPLPIPSWSAARYTERIKKGAKLLSEVFTNAATPVERLTTATSSPTPTSKR